MIRIIPCFYPLMLKSCFNSGDIFHATTQVVLAFAWNGDARVVASFSLFTYISQIVCNRYTNFVSNKSVGGPPFWCARGSLGKAEKGYQAARIRTQRPWRIIRVSWVKMKKGNRSIVKAATLKRQFGNPRRRLYSNSRDARKEVIYS